jgi:hypothetical protein
LIAHSADDRADSERDDSTHHRAGLGDDQARQVDPANLVGQLRYNGARQVLGDQFAPES